MGKLYYIGWDVGGWNCDKGKSRDAIVILDGSGEMIHDSLWRGNLKDAINQAGNTLEFLRRLFELSKVEDQMDSLAAFVLAIDTPLAYSREFIDLITRQQAAAHIDHHIENPYLFRATERYVFEKRGHRPLSAVQDLIGSQSTKGMHVLSKFAPHIESTGIWTDHHCLRVLEAYPSLHKTIGFPGDGPVQEDIADAYRCAVIAYKFGTALNELETPPASVPEEEGWIWFLKKSD